MRWRVCQAMKEAGVNCCLMAPVGLDRSPSLSVEVMTMMGATAFVTLSTVVRQQKDSGIRLPPVFPSLILTCHLKR